MSNKKKLVSENQMNLTYIRENNSIRIHYIFWIYAEFEADNEIDTSSLGKKTTSIDKQKPVYNG